MIRPFTAVCYFITLLLTGWGAGQVTAQTASSPPELNNDSTLVLETHLEEWIPPSPTVSFNEAQTAAQQGLFRPLKSRMVTRLDQVIWYKFTFQTAEGFNDQALLNFQEFLYRELEVFTEQHDQWQHSKTGLSYPYNQRPFNYRYFAIPVDAIPGETQTIYIRIHTFTPVFIVPVLQSMSQFFDQSLKQSMLNIFIAGAMVGMIFYLWSASRLLFTLVEKILFNGFLICPVLFFIFYDGHLFYLLDLHNGLYEQAFPLVTNFWGIFAIVFFQYFFNLKQQHRLLYQSGNALLSIILISCIYSVLIDASAISYITLNLSALIFLFMVTTAFHVAKQHMASARLFFIAIVFYLVFVTSRILISTDTLPFTIYERSIIFAGWLIFMVFLCAAIYRQLNTNYNKQKAFERKALEIEVKESTRNQFLETLSSEIRTPVNGVLGMAELLSESRLDSTQNRYVSILLNSAKSLIAIVNDILDLYKAENDKLELETLYFNLDQLLVSTLSSFSHSRLQSPFKYDLAQRHPIPFYLKGDPNRLQQIIRNLLSGVQQFIDRGTIELGVKEYHLQDTVSTLEFNLTIDSPQANSINLSKIFDITENVNASIGIAICKRLINIMGGSYGISPLNDHRLSIWFRLSFEIDLQRQALLKQKTEHLSQYKIAGVFINPRSSHGLQVFFHSNNIHFSDWDYDQNLNEVNFAEIDILYLSNATGEYTRQWLYAAQDHDVPVVIFNHFSNNIISQTECQDLGVGLINPPYGMGDIIDITEKMLSDNPDQAIAKAPEKNLSDLCVLVAEDNPINTKVAQAMLESFGISADFVTNGREALESFQSAGSYDLVLMDCEMPEIDGFEATQKIRNIEIDKRQKPTLIYALTAYADDDHKARCIIAGMDGVLVKPLQKALLKDVLQKA